MGMTALLPAAMAARRKVTAEPPASISSGAVKCAAA